MQPRIKDFAHSLSTGAWSAVVLLAVLAPGVWGQDEGASGNRGRVAFGPGVLIANLMLTQGDRDGDQGLSPEEFAQLADVWFARLDAGQAGRLTQEEFLRGFEQLLPQRGAGNRSPQVTNLGNSRFLGLFVAVDRDRDGALTSEELSNALQEWAVKWRLPEAGSVAREQLVNGLNAALPRTNMGEATGQETQERIAGLPLPPPSPVLAPAEARQAHQLAPGFRIELAASEPLVQDPIAITFDAAGRMYVLELRSFMQDIRNRDERAPISRISRLEDTDDDGRFDRAAVFLDQLVLPRSILATRGGVLYVADGKLYFATDQNDDGQADENRLVDPDYGGGNLEHAPNGLMPALDNWIYNARSRVRYRWAGDTLVKQETENRGQWGMTQDNYGRLFYNVNNSQLLGDVTPPNYLLRNSNHVSTAGQNLFVATDQRVFPIRMNTAINRGYIAGVLDLEGRAHVFASSCSPVIYRGDNFPPEFVGNAFVCDPALNLIKRNLVFAEGLSLRSRFAYEDREFLASTDERFRPVNAFNGPDGALWVVDMYRGIVQHGLFMTSYLRRDTLERGLDQGVHLGRIYRVTSAANQPGSLAVLGGADHRSAGANGRSNRATRLVAALTHPNGWVRDTAQRLLVERRDTNALPALLELAASSTNELARIHALWALEGLFLWPDAVPEADRPVPVGAGAMLRFVPRDFRWQAPAMPDEVLAVMLGAMRNGPLPVQVAALRTADSLTQGSIPRQRQLLAALWELAPLAAAELRFQMALTAGNLPKPDSLVLLGELADRNADELLMREAILSGLENSELAFLESRLQSPGWTERRAGRPALIQALSAAVLAGRRPDRVERLLALANEHAGATAWRQTAILAGLAGFKPRRTDPPLRLAAAPVALTRVDGEAHPENRALIEQIKPLLAWPGHQWAPLENAPGEAARPVLTAAGETMLAEGALLYQQVCAGCHGLAGEGVKPLAPPLAGSDWVAGSADRLIRILLHGLAGPIQVSGVTYQPPDIQPEMPPLAALADAQIAAVLSYVRSEWGGLEAIIPVERVALIRAETVAREAPWTEAALRDVR